MSPNTKTTYLLSYILLASASCSYLNLTQEKAEYDKRSSRATYEFVNVKEWQKKNQNAELKGWDYVAEKLIEAKVPKNIVKQIFSDKLMPAWTPIPFKVKPKESAAIYASLNNSRARANALAFYHANERYFQSAENTFHVPKEYILAILQIETACGQNTGNEPIFYWLARLVSTGFGPNLKFNLENSEEKPSPTLKELEERADWLEEEFMPHLIALIDLASKLKISPMEVKGSKGGALGYPQFLPANISKYGVDGNRDGSINIFTAPDAIHSIAKFLVSHGWSSNSDRTQIINSILKYNRSTAYAETVYELAQDLKRGF